MKPTQSIFHPDFQAFQLVARHENISIAARKTGQDPGNLSRFLARLERDLGYALFVRKRDGLKLTADGARLLEALNKAQESFANQINAEPLSEIRIGFSPGIGYEYFSAHYLKLIQKLNLKPHFTIEASIVLFEKLKDRELDFVIAPKQVNFPGVVVKNIGSDGLALCSQSGKTQKTLLVHSQMFNLEKTLSAVGFDKLWKVDDYFVLAKMVSEDDSLMGVLPDALLKTFEKLEAIKVFPNEGKITAMSWPGSVGMKLLRQ